MTTIRTGWSVHDARSVADVHWGELSLRVLSYLGTKLPPAALITSARAVVLCPGGILVVADRTTVHILPGGRLDPDETPDQALRREVPEETGWALGELELLGCLRYRHRGPEPATAWKGAYPEFFQLVYVAAAGAFDDGARERDGYELWSEFRPIDAVRALALTRGERVFLDAALASRIGRRLTPTPAPRRPEPAPP